ncbi:hypothetical protein H2199_000585 [Coniosporium tulheliwenetii]|uniref:Uncharacterized protein n=2 Tax=Coniosporium tulheliwenetii TaxID=3383036 RepID=A0ACC2YMU4_9PEZI|nr:hypothetical protein H2199_008109 [Cladosporium sp. JES 115]KAJ9649806.1 hypothetical protein H2199_000585 [Cladosporium sp. JES 115]
MTHQHRKEPARQWTGLSAGELERRLAALDVYLNTLERVVVCRQCKYALQPSGDCVSKHLWEKHGIPVQARRGLKSYIDSLRLPDPNELATRPDGCEPHPCLALQPGAACKPCGFRSTSLELVRRHVSKEHGVTGKRDGGLRSYIDDGLSLQSWTQNGARSYWIVRTTDDGSVPPLEVVGTPRRRQRLGKLHQGERDRIAAEAPGCMRTDTGIDDLTLTSNWMRRTGWARTFRGADRVVLRRLTLAPHSNGLTLTLGRHGDREVESGASDERRLLVIGRALDAFFDRCEDTVRFTDHSILCWLRGHFPDRPFKAPFQLPGRNPTKLRYRSLWKRLTYFAIRLFRLDPTIRKEILSFELTPEQSAPIAKLWDDGWWDRNMTAATRPGPAEHLLGLTDGVRAGSRERAVQSEPSAKRRSARWKSRGQRSDTECRTRSSSPVPRNRAFDLGESLPSAIGGADSDDDEDAISYFSEETDEDCAESGSESERSAVCDDGIRICQARVDKNDAPSIDVGSPLDQLADLAGLLAASLCREHYYDGRSSSSLLVYFSGILGQRCIQY